ncbi:MAG: exodeoxyribonuclease V subunit gamma [Buchnera aphidicola (Tetraneura sorini)]
MLFIYQSNDSKILLRKSLKIIKDQPLKNPLKTETFLVKNKEIEKWIKIYISHFFGIYANIDFLSIDYFIKKIFIKINSDVLNQYLLNKKKIFWKLMNLKNINDFLRYKKNNIKKEEILEFSYKFYKLFCKYDIYRPNLIKSWSENQILNRANINSIPIQKWQKKIWEQTINFSDKNIIFNYLNLENLILKTMKKKKKKRSRIFIFDSIDTPKIYINTLYKFRKFYDIHMFINNPFFGLHKNYSEIKKNRSKKSFILNFGEIGIDQIENLLKKKKKKYFFYFQKSKENKLLNNIQNKILQESNLKKRKKNQKFFLNSIDDSISIHICNSKQQEIEVLHCNLLTILNKNKKINFNEILVVAKDIQAYIPYIYGIFNKFNQIPFVISNYFDKQEEEISKIIENILNLKIKKITYEEFFSLLELPLISEQFLIDTKNIFELKKCIQELGIKFGINKKNLKKQFNINIKYNTWEFGINRILLGYATNDSLIWNSILSYKKIKKNIYEEIIRLKIFLNLIYKWKKKISIQKKIKNWIPIFEEFINDFIPERYKKDKIFFLMDKKWKSIINNSLKSNYEKKISLEILIKIFLLKKIKRSYQSNLFEGKVNFCNLNSIENVTSNIICTLGINKQNYSMNNDNVEYIDLIKNYPEKGDLNSQKENLYSFLKIILNSKKYLLISYSKEKNEKNIDNCSFLIKELKKYLKKNFFIKTKSSNKKNEDIFKYISFKYPINPFLEKKNINFNNCQINNNNLWIEKKYKKRNNTKKIKLSKIEIKSINFEKFINFWKHPIKFLLNHRLNIYYSNNYQFDLNNEPFEINFINSYLIKKKILKQMIYKKDINEIFQNYQLSGVLPNNTCAKYFWEKCINELYPLCNKINSLNLKEKEIVLKLKLKKFYLYNCKINETKDNNLIIWKPKKINIIDGLSLWLKHLVYCICMKPNKTSFIFGTKNTSWIFPILKKSKAKNYLLKYVKGYIKGHQKPIFLTKSGFLWIQKEFNISNINKKKNVCFNYNSSSNNSKNIFLNTWNGSSQYYGEKNDLYIKKIISKLDKKKLHKICKAANKWALPVLLNKFPKKRKIRIEKK